MTTKTVTLFPLKTLDKRIKDLIHTMNGIDEKSTHWWVQGDKLCVHYYREKK